MKVTVDIPDGKTCCGCNFLEEKVAWKYCWHLRKSLRPMKPCTSLWERKDRRPKKHPDCPNYPKGKPPSKVKERPKERTRTDHERRGETLQPGGGR